MIGTILLPFSVGFLSNGMVNIVGFAVSDIKPLYSDINLAIKIVALDIIDYSLEVDKK